MTREQFELGDSGVVQAIGFDAATGDPNKGQEAILAGQARGLQGRYLPQIQSEASRMHEGGLPAWLCQA